VPAKYLESHEYEDDANTNVVKYKSYNKDGSIPLDVAVTRWLAMEKKVIVMPNSYFYAPNSPYKCDNYIRLAICKGV
jgi:aspartate/methionine/tyrosine aminotransferase